MSAFFENIRHLIDEIEKQESLAMEEAAEVIAKSIENGGIMQLFGSGHSHLLAQETYYRAGGLVPAKPIQIEGLMLHSGAITSSENEKNLSKSEEFWQEISLKPNDVLVIISTSGRNPIPVEMALRAKKLGIPVITLQSLFYSQQPSRHPSGKRLEDVATIVLNTHVPIGDGIVTDDNLQYGPVSTIAGATIINEVIVQVIQILQSKNIEPPVFSSNNIEAENNNDVWLEKYQNRINFN